MPAGRRGSAYVWWRRDVWGGGGRVGGAEAGGRGQWRRWRWRRRRRRRSKERPAIEVAGKLKMT